MTEPQVFQAIALKHGVRLLSQGIKPNRDWTPKATLATVARLTGQPIRKGPLKFIKAEADVQAWLDERGVVE